MISTKNIVDRANEKISEGNLTELQISQLNGADQFLKNTEPNTVQTFNDLPAAVDNLGRIVYVIDEKRYYYSNGVFWEQDLSTEISTIDVLFAWGSGYSGRLGTGDIISRSLPVTVVGGITNWAQVSAGPFSHSLGVTDDGIAYAWGQGSAGRLGTDDLDRRSSPVTVVGGITDWSQVSAGYEHSVGVTDSGIAYAWGYAGNGQLGTDDLINRSSPVTVIGGITNWTQVSAGNFHNVGITDSGIAYAWGQGSAGQLGTNESAASSSPVTVVGGITNWSQVSAGNQHNVGVTDSGIAYAWGIGGNGRLGDGASINRSSPVTLVGGITNWTQVSAGNFHNVGITDSGIAYAWGPGGSGRLGTGDNIARSSPVTLVGGITNWSQVSAGNTHSLGITDTGIAYAWGSGNYGLLGTDDTIARSSPVTVIGGITNWTQVSAGIAHSLGVITIAKGFD